MSEQELTTAELAYAQAQKYGEELARLYTAEKKRRQQLETTTQKLQTIFDTTPTGLVVVDNELNILEANLHFLDMFEQDADCIGQPLYQLIPVESLLETMLSTEMETSGMGKVEIEISEPVAHSLLINLAPLNAGQGWVLILHDLTERRRLEGLKDEFINIAAHELRTPLAGVIGFVGLLGEELEDSDNLDLKNLVTLILQSTQRLKVIIDELVSFAATQSEIKIINNLNISDINVDRFLNNAVANIWRQAEERQISCKLDIEDVPLEIKGDQFILARVIRQLLDNALLFNKANGEGKIFIRAKQLAWSDLSPSEQETLGKNGKQKNATLIEIEDTGIGIPQTEIDKVFDKFYQVEEHLTRGVGGLGLGLTIARRGVHQHGGLMTLTSKLGHGTTVRILLPTIAQADASIDSRLDVAHLQMLSYAKDTARAIWARQKLSKRMDKIQYLSREISDTLAQTSSDNSHPQVEQMEKLVKELVEVSTR